MNFSGSYRVEDVTFLLKPGHYSERAAEEWPPDDEDLAALEEAFALGRRRLAEDVAGLALALAARPPGEIVLASLARAGTPLGILLCRTLLHLGRKAFHYTLAVVRDHGPDEKALDHILERHSAASVVFVDGWTAKGALAQDLRRAVVRYNGSRGVLLDPSLTVVADLGGVAGLAASCDDYLIPCSLSSAVIAGCVGRMPAQRDPADGASSPAWFLEEELLAEDRSRRFLDLVAQDVARALPAATPALWSPEMRLARRGVVEGFLANVASWFRLGDWHGIEPGVGEATRALLRQVPERLLLEHEDDPNLRHLLLLARRRGVTVERCTGLPFRAVALLSTGEGRGSRRPRGSK